MGPRYHLFFTVVTLVCDNGSTVRAFDTEASGCISSGSCLVHTSHQVSLHDVLSTLSGNAFHYDLVVSRKMRL